MANGFELDVALLVEIYLENDAPDHQGLIRELREHYNLTPQETQTVLWQIKEGNY